MVLMAVNFSGLYYFKILDPNQTVYLAVYTIFLSEAVESFNSHQLRLERRSVSWENAIIQHDNARPHISSHTQEFIQAKKCQLLTQSPHSPDLNILDRLFFQSWK